ncbi:hypothetical protein HA41_06040 [Pantoea conspicua]|uniref:Uncharacterized protein n=1 Tax=Pantoea conspicua TaxID=472705 RepID=A0A1X1BYQ7_9GAMM|nr:hypothetical protein HA41_06040 [Pantoea conspicua]
MFPLLTGLFAAIVGWITAKRYFAAENVKFLRWSDQKSWVISHFSYIIQSFFQLTIIRQGAVFIRHTEKNRAGWFFLFFFFLSGRVKLVGNRRR